MVVQGEGEGQVLWQSVAAPSRGELPPSPQRLRRRVSLALFSSAYVN